MKMETFTGRTIAPTRPDHRAICIEDIARSLSMQCRFAGHCKRFYSVGLHSLFVYALVKTQTDCIETLRWALLHDAAEAYLHDINTPLKTSQTMEQYCGLEIDWAIAVAAAFGVDLCRVDNLLVKEADTHAVRVEAAALMPSRGRDWELPSTRPFPQIIVGAPHLNMPMEAVEDMFLRTWEALCAASS